jgi:rubrerythrin
MEETKKNLGKAFAGESQARNKYTYFAKIAEKEGYNYISKVFKKTAKNEEQHAKQELKFLNGIGKTEDNLKASIEGEHYEVTEMYPEFAKVAKEEGRKDIAVLFEEIAKAEKSHELLFRRLLEMVKNGTVFSRESPIDWKCEKCGLIENSKEAPKNCSCCKHPQKYFEPSDI